MLFQHYSIAIIELFLTPQDYHIGRNGIGIGHASYPVKKRERTMNNITALQDTLFPRGRLSGWVSQVVRAVSESYSRRATLKKLAALDNHMLDDIGLTRGDLNRLTLKRGFESQHQLDIRAGGQR